jgi:hypothetical protein
MLHLFTTRRLFLVGLGLAGAAPAAVAAPSLLPNGDFSVTQTDNPSLPAQWRVDGTAKEIGLDSSKTRDGRATLRVAFAEGAPYAGVIQQLPAAAWRGRRLSLRAHIAREGERALAGVWMGVYDAQRQRLLYRNTYDTVQKGDGQWVGHALEIEVPEQADRLLVGASIHEADGVMWVDRVDLQEIKSR